MSSSASGSKIKRTITKLYKSHVDEDYAWQLYYTMREELDWVEGVRSKRTGFTRYAYSMASLVDPRIETTLSHTIAGLILKVLSDLDISVDKCLDVYINYYEDGSNYTPNHSHNNTDQVVISLGATRTLTIGTKRYEMNNGDVIIFGSSVHGVPKEPHVKEGRISIALFIKKE